MSLTKEQELWLNIPAEKRVEIIQQAIKTAIADAVTEHEEQKSTKSSSEKDD